MGWDCTHRPKGISHKAWFANQWADGFELLDMAQKGTTLYGALRCPAGDVVGIVILQRWAPKAYWNYCTKSMSEEMGPFYYDCPERILALLTPSESKEANEWRAKCWENVYRRKERPRISKGDIVRFEKPLKFTDGSEHDTFQFERGSTFRTRGPWSYKVRISGWADRAYSVVT